MFCKIDDFCEIFEKRWQQELLTLSERKRNKKFNLCLSEVMTIIIYFYQFNAEEKPLRAYGLTAYHRIHIVIQQRQPEQLSS